MMFLSSALFVATVLGATDWMHPTPPSIQNVGKWHEYYCPDGMLAKGFWYRFEAHIDGDDTAGNAVQLCCVSDINDATYERDCEKSVGNSGDWGDWTLHVCPLGSFMNGYRQRIEAYQYHGTSGDNTGHNGLEISCSDGTTTKYNGLWGDWSAWDYCRGEWFVTGLWVQYQDHVGRNDDSALNNVWLMCQSPKIGKFRGHWELWKSHNEGLDREVGTSIENSHGTEETKEETESIEVSAGVSAELYGMGFSVEVGEASTKSMSKTAIKGLTIGYAESVNTPCADNVGREAIYQFVLDSEYEQGQEGLVFRTDHTSCNPVRFPPLCEPETCHDDLCRDCCDNPSCGVHENSDDVLKGWIQCAAEGGVCGCKGEVRYGHTAPNEQWSNAFKVDQSIPCTNEAFGYPQVGAFQKLGRWVFGGDGVSNMCQCRKAEWREVVSVQDSPAVAAWALVAGAAIAVTAAGFACYKMKVDKYADIDIEA